MDINIAYYRTVDISRLFGGSRADWLAFEVLDAERRGKLRRVRTEATDEGDERAFGSGRYWWNPIESEELVGFVDEDSATFADVADYLWSPLVDDANPEECTVHVFRSRKTWASIDATARESCKGYLDAELRSPFYSNAGKIERLLSLNGYDVISLPWGRDNALEFPGGVKVWAD